MFWVAVYRPMERYVAIEFIGVKTAVGIDYRRTAVAEAVHDCELFAGFHVP